MLNVDEYESMSNSSDKKPSQTGVVSDKVLKRWAMNTHRLKAFWNN